MSTDPIYSWHGTKSDQKGEANFSSLFPFLLSSDAYGWAGDKNSLAFLGVQLCLMVPLGWRDSGVMINGVECSIGMLMFNPQSLVDRRG